MEVLNSLEDGSTSPVDLLSLIKILGKEISTCETLLKDELEKRKRYKVHLTFSLAEASGINIWCIIFCSDLLEKRRYFFIVS